jgi:histidyl-tRNA synthetase
MIMDKKITKPAIPKGTRDFTPDKMLGRNYIFDTAKNVFKQFGFVQIETPATENLSTLTGKYGEEGDQLMFKILMRGDKFKSAVENVATQSSEHHFSDLALRYDLTVPFARFVVQHQNEITFPFKRFQIQPVWRADRPQKGRYREFYQCDIDVVGTDSLWCEVEFIQIFNLVLSQLKVPGFVIKMNNRKILSGIAELIGAEDKIVDITVAIDKLDKIGLEEVVNELKSKGLSDEAIEKLQPILQLKGKNEDLIQSLEQVLSKSEIGLKGLEELKFILEQCKKLQIDEAVRLDITLARGLNYYTGAIFEVGCEGFKGSICGGGRYDGLTDLFGLKGVSGVGISFGADRIYDVLEQNNLFPKDELNQLDVLALNFGNQEVAYVAMVLQQLRAKGVNCELYPDSAKMKKQMQYADKKRVKYVLIVGEEELQKNTLVLKNMVEGTQTEFTLNNLINYNF